MKSSKMAARLRLFAIYRELGYIPWHKQAGEKKERRHRRENDVYMGAKETIPFLNEDSKRTIVQLILRPGYLMRDYIFRGRYEHYLAPLTALIVFYTVFSLALAVIKPDAFKDTVGDKLYESLRGVSSDVKRLDSAQFRVDAQPELELELDPDVSHPVAFEDRNGEKVQNALHFLTESFALTRLDLYPEAVDAPWKQSLAALEGNLRSKGIPLFLENFIFLWLAMAVLLRKHKVSFSGAAAVSAYFLCQYCLFLFLVLLVSFGGNVELGLLLTGLLLFIDYHQLLGLKYKSAFWLTVKTGLLVILFRSVFYLIVGAGLIIAAYASSGIVP